MKILIVEDSKTIALYLQAFLSKQGYKITDTVDSGEKALESTDKVRPDLILMDINLAGDLDGIETAEIIREKFSIPIIYVTAQYSPEIMERAANTMPYAYLKKPIEDHQLVAEVDLALRRKAIEDKTDAERNKFEEALKASQEKYRRLSEDMPILVCTFLADSTLTYVNKAYCDFFGMRENEIIGKKWIEFLPPEAREKAFSNFLHLSPDSPINTYEHPVYKPDGSTGWQQWTDRALFDENGLLLYYQSIGEDITQRKLAEQKMRQNENLLSIAGNLARLGGWSVNLAENRVIWSDQVALIHDMPPGYSPTVEEGISFYAPEFQGRIKEVFNACATQGIPYDEEMQIITAKGRRVWIRTNGQAEKDESGEIVQVQGGFQDISERKGLEMKLAHAQKVEAVGELAAGIAHEINTPAQYVGDNTRFLQDAFNDILLMIEKIDSLLNKTGDGSQKANFEEIKSDADYGFLAAEVPKSIEQSLDGISRISTIVQAMKKFSHPGQDEQITAFDLKSALENTIIISRNEWKYHAEVKTEFDPDLPNIQGYPHDLNQVFLNLIINAAHAIKEKFGDSQEKGLITIRARMEQGDAVVEVSDDGTGIPEKHQHRVFDQFFTTKPVGRGTGQGLAIAYAIVVNNHKGSIYFDTRPGQGTTFIVRIPQSERGDR